MTLTASISVAVTGVGAIIGQGIVRGLRSSGHDIKIIGVDRSERSPGTYSVDVFEKKPMVPEDTQDYLDYWEKLILTHDVKLVLPGLEIDMQFLNQHRPWFTERGVVLGLNTPKLIEQTRDKWSFGEILSAINYPVIPSVQPQTWAEALGKLGSAPLLLKPLTGNGSRGIVKLEDEQDFLYWSEKTAGTWMLQRIVGSSDQEYTVGVFGLGDGKILAPIIFRRRLSAAGNTLEAELVMEHPILQDAVIKLCRHFKPVGPTNLQFRVELDTPYLLEINPRFSSSNSLRTAFGFNEAEMSVDYYLYGRTPRLPVLREGIAWRYTEDFVKYASHSF
jgi:carbamoyl-phosphate synthase large subunit